MVTQLVHRFLDWFKAVKSSLKFVLFVILGFAVYAVVRSASFGEHVLGLHPVVAWPLALAIESFIIAGTAISINARLVEFSKKLSGEDGSQARKTVRMARTSIWIGFIALLCVAFADGYIEKQSGWIGLITAGIQTVQMIFIIAYTELEFIDKSDKITLTLSRRTAARQRVPVKRKCPCCGREFTANNFKKHTEACQ